MAIFEASYAKLARAQKFIDELKSEFEAYANSNPMELRSTPTELIPGLPAGGVSLKPALRDIGINPSVVLGDAVHNMRAALDLMASELAIINGQSPNNVYFPFASSKDELPKRIKDKGFNRTGDDAVQLLHTFAPYSGGNDALRAIHDLDIQDKHTALIVSVQTFDAIARGISITQLLHEAMQGRIHLTMENLAFRFPEGSVLSGCEIIPTLEGLMQTIKGILEAFAALVASRRS